MISTVFFAVLGLTIIFFLLTVYWKSLILGSITTILWLILGISIYNFEIPYTAIQSDDTIVHGVHTIESMYVYAPLFWLMTFITMFYLFITIIFPMLQQKFSKMM
jgi:hypothetical protein